MVHHRYATVEGHRLFYREAGSAGMPAIVLLHGFPTSSFMFRNLIPRLEGYRVIAPDHLGFGLSDAPSADEFGYSFDALADLTAGLLDQLGVTRYAIVVQDYGAPIGWRLAIRNPDAVVAVISQNGNGYDEGFVADNWQAVWNYQREQSPENAAALRAALTLEGIRFQYVTGVEDESILSPDTWHLDHAFVSRPGNAEVQLKLFLDYATNPPLYPALHQWLRSRQVPVLATWGKYDPYFGPDGARAFARDTANAEIHLFEGGHFLLESAGDEVAALIREFLAKHLPTA
ncbi:alpha/beta fold hydrolase [Nonomuraea rubra]|uniref:Pimeloyl-ACP methyl ester carboxylesterase n=1 Tax=Nonomuraea rubra TaxID=46180 RepID=A0A7X0NUB8_9ACTN|nr:alpha/beta hydrolase [Nonomuraea rubra]MBB6549561.1 pimeloyl-ACP methyl ester carboxylesterase [Nonomuraea rubra]